MKEMEKEEMKKFVENVGRKELFEDMKQNGGYPRIYFKAVCATLIASGYDQHWVTHELLEALEAEYPGN